MNNNSSYSLVSYLNVIIATLLFTVAFFIGLTQMAFAVTKAELVELYIALDIIPEENGDASRAVAEAMPGGISLGDFTDLFVLAELIPEVNADEAYEVIGESRTPPEVSLAATSPDSATIKVDTDNDTDDVTILVFDIDFHTSERIWEFPVSLQTGTADVLSVVENAYLKFNGVEYDDYTVSGSGQTVTLLFQFDSEVAFSGGDSGEFSLGIDFQETTGNYENAETISASVGASEVAAIVHSPFISGLSLSELVAVLVALGHISEEDAGSASTLAGVQEVGTTQSMFVDKLLASGFLAPENEEAVRKITDAERVSGDVTGSAVGAEHVLFSEGLYVEIVSSDVDRTVVDGGPDIGEFEMVFDATAFEEDFYVSTDVRQAITYRYLRADVDEVLTPPLLTESAVISSNADKESETYVVREGDTERFTLRTFYSGEPSEDSFYRLELLALFGGLTKENPTEREFQLRPVEDFRSAFISLMNPTLPPLPPLPPLSKPAIDILEVSNDVFSPNDDGFLDTVDVTMTFSDTVNVHIGIYGGLGNDVISFLSTTSVKELAFTWDGQRENGTPYYGEFTVEVHMVSTTNGESDTAQFTLFSDVLGPVLTRSGTSPTYLLPGEEFSGTVTSVDDREGDLTPEMVITTSTSTDVFETLVYEPSVTTYTYSSTDSVGNTSILEWLVVQAPKAIELFIDGKPLDGFDPTVPEYTVELSAGATTTVITATPERPSVRVEVAQAEELPGTAVVSLFAEDEKVQTDYTISLTVAEPDEVTKPTPAPSSGGGGGGGGGGGSSRDRKAPDELVLNINEGATTTTSTAVTLTLNAEDRRDPIEFQVNNTGEFEDEGEWVELVEKYPWILTAGNGEKTVYARFKDRRDNISEVIADTIVLEGQDEEALAQSGQTTTPAASSASSPQLGLVLGAETFRFTSNLSLGMQSDAVRELQERLREGGYFTFHTSTGYFGPITVDAVKKYQMSEGLPATGVVDAATQARLNERGGDSEDGISLETFVRLLIALEVISQEKAELALMALASLE